MIMCTSCSVCCNVDDKTLIDRTCATMSKSKRCATFDPFHAYSHTTSLPCRNWGTLSESERQPYIDESTRRRRAFIAWHQAQLGMVRDGVCTDASAAIAAGGARVCWLWATCAGCLRQFKIKTVSTTCCCACTRLCGLKHGMWRERL